MKLEDSSLDPHLVIGGDRDKTELERNTKSIFIRDRLKGPPPLHIMRVYRT